MKWNSTLGKRLIRTRVSEPGYDQKWGNFLPSRRFNVDQSPLSFTTDASRTYKEIDPGNSENRNKKVWSAQPTSGGNKRFCSLNICFSPKGEQPRLAIIFRGKGQRISAIDKEAWNKDVVDIYFQSNLWADTNFRVDWTERTLKSAVKTNIGTAEFVLFCDSLAGQIAERFGNSVKEMNRIPWYGIPNATDIWQPVDGGYAATLKAFAKHEFFAWLDDNENCEKWYGADSKITASEKRILISH